MTPDGSTAPADTSRELFEERETSEFRTRWTDIQAGFVDGPRRAVEHADQLVADVVKRLTDTFAQERANLEQYWSQRDTATTEDLRLSLQRYRAFFDRLLSL
jgi:hypothetical protein